MRSAPPPARGRHVEGQRADAVVAEALPELDAAQAPAPEVEAADAAGGGAGGNAELAPAAAERPLERRRRRRRPSTGSMGPGRHSQVTLWRYGRSRPSASSPVSVFPSHEAWK